MFSNISKKTFFLLPALFLSSHVIGAGAGSLTSAAAEGNWGLSFHEENTPPTANASTDELAQYDAYYMQDTDEKILYLTFDAGYENGNTEKILDVLKSMTYPLLFSLSEHISSQIPNSSRGCARTDTS